MSRHINSGFSGHSVSPQGEATSTTYPDTSDVSKRTKQVCDRPMVFEQDGGIAPLGKTGVARYSHSLGS